MVDRRHTTGVGLMAAPTLAGLAAQIAALTDRITALEAWRQTIIDLAASREKRIADLEAFVADNATLIDGLSQSDEASGWKKWREDKNTGPAQ